MVNQGWLADVPDSNGGADPAYAGAAPDADDARRCPDCGRLGLYVSGLWRCDGDSYGRARHPARVWSTDPDDVGDVDDGGAPCEGEPRNFGDL